MIGNSSHDNHDRAGTIAITTILTYLDSLIY